jgi:predicted MFS family arabinose efflux permease
MHATLPIRSALYNPVPTMTNAARPSSPRDAPSPLRLVFVVFLPFSVGFFLSFLFRNANAVIANELARQFGVSSGSLGFLTSTYFLAFAAMQVPVGVLLDRYGPRRVVAGLLCMAALGAVLFAAAAGLGGLTLGRALIGVGVSACLMGAMKGFAIWFPLERLATLNGWVIAFGGLGALVATAPIEMLSTAFGWRMTFVGLAALSLAVAAWIFAVVPEKPLPGAREGWGEQIRRVGEIVATPVFWRLGLPMVAAQGIYQALFGLWIVPWLMDAEGLSRGAAAQWLFWMAFCYMVASPVFGAGADALAARGVLRLTVLKLGSLVTLLSFVALGFLGAGRFPLLLLYSFAVVAPILSYALLARAYAPQVSGRVTTAVNMSMFLCGFLTQWMTGALLARFGAGDGRYAPEGYALVFGVLAGVQGLVLLWLLTLRSEPVAAQVARRHVPPDGH